MKINISNNSSTSEFVNVERGQVFFLGNILYMKIVAGTLNAVSLETGHCTYIFSDEIIMPVNAEITLL